MIEYLSPFIALPDVEPATGRKALVDGVHIAGLCGRTNPCQAGRTEKIIPLRTEQENSHEPVPRFPKRVVY